MRKSYFIDFFHFLPIQLLKFPYSTFYGLTKFSSQKLTFFNEKYKACHYEIVTVSKAGEWNELD